MIRRILYRPFFIKLLHWEYWPFHLVYALIYPYWFVLCLRARSFFFFNTSNPSINNGGFLMESKKAIYDLIPREYYPRTLLFRAGIQPSEIMAAIRQSRFDFPLVAKPDIGMKGLSVKKVHDENDLTQYALQSRVDFLVQEFIRYEQEVGIFYYRYPDEETGHISGIVQKEFLAVKGDGVSSMRDLLLKDRRYILQIRVLEKTYGHELNRVLEMGEEHLLVPYGNHSRGAKFIDVTDWKDEELRISIDRICRRIPGFYFGRLDVRYNTWEELKQGKNFSIVELNGAGSEPTHMYDPKHSLLFAWKEIIRHWNILFRISRINHRLLSKPYMKTPEGIQMLKESRAYVKLIKENGY
jgi:hypothetical protein